MGEEQEEGHVPGSSSITTGRRILILARSFHQDTGRVTGDIVTSDWLRQLPAQQIVRCTSRLLLHLICTSYFLFDFLSDSSLHHSTRLFSFLYIRIIITSGSIGLLGISSFGFSYTLFVDCTLTHTTKHLACFQRPDSNMGMSIWFFSILFNSYPL